MEKVNLFIAGVNKSGTTWLYHLLKEHPDISFADQKEVDFFNADCPGKLNEYHSHFDFNQKTKYFADGSTRYIRDLKTAKKIKRYNPDAKIIIMVRDPIKRLLSQFYFRKQIGSIPENSSLNTMISGQDDIIMRDSHYEKYIPAWIDVFDRENVRIFSFENFLEHKDAYWNEILEFLNIETIPIPEVSKESKNVTGSKNFRIFYKYTILPIKIKWPSVYGRLLQSKFMKKSRQFFLEKLGTQEKEINGKTLSVLDEEFNQTYVWLNSLGFGDIYSETRMNNFLEFNDGSRVYHIRK